MAQASGILGDRWSLLILREAFYGVIRFADMQADIGVPRSILTTRLRTLVEAGLLEQFDYRENGARARRGYRLSKRGRELVLGPSLAMKQWWMRGRTRPRRVHFVPKGGQNGCACGLLDENGQEVDPSSPAIAPGLNGLKRGGLWRFAPLRDRQATSIATFCARQTGCDLGRHADLRCTAAP